jgi:hypothetical protein
MALDRQKTVDKKSVFRQVEKNKKSGTDWRSTDPKSKAYIKNKPQGFLSIGKKVKELDSILTLDGATQIVGSTDAKYYGSNNKEYASITDLNNLIDTGVYTVDSANVDNCPISGLFYISVIRHAIKDNGDKWVQQTITDVEGVKGAKYYREIRDDNNGWSAWTPLQYGLELKEMYLKDLVEFRNDWEHYNDEWGTRIVKKPDGTVIIVGILRYGDNDTEVCTLPEEYRPIYNIITNQVCGNDKHIRVDLYPDGIIKVTGDGTRDDSNDWVAFNFTYNTKSPI